MTFLVQQLSDATDLHELRRRILRNNDPAISVHDPRDVEEAAIHLAIVRNEQVVVCGSLYPSTSPLDESVDSYQLRYMAADDSVRGSGAGRALLERAGDIVLLRGVEHLWANARDTALGFYLATGWTAVPGSEHLSKETQLPHTVVVKSLRSH